MGPKLQKPYCNRVRGCFTFHTMHLSASTGCLAEHISFSAHLSIHHFIGLWNSHMFTRCGRSIMILLSGHAVCDFLFGSSPNCPIIGVAIVEESLCLFPSHAPCQESLLLCESQVLFKTYPRAACGLKCPFAKWCFDLRLLLFAPIAFI